MKLRTMKKVIALVIMVIMLMTAVSALASTAEEKLNTLSQLAVGYLNAGNFDKAMDYLDKALDLCTEETYPELYAELHMNKGLILANQKDYEKGLAELDEALRVNPELSNAYLIRSAVFSETGETEKSDEAYQKYLELEQVDGAAKIYYSATTKMNAARYTEAAAEFETIFDDAEYGTAAVYSAGSCYMQTEEYEKALACFTRYPESDSQPDDLHYNIAFSSMKLNKLDEAIAEFTVSIETEPYKAAAQYYRALCALTKTGDTTLEEEKSTELLKMAADDFTAYLEAATETAKAEAEEGTEVLEVVNDANYYRGACYLTLNEFEKAEADFEACISHDLYPDESIYYRGLTRLQLGKYEEAKADLTASIEKEFNLNDSLRFRAIASNFLGEYQEAIDDLTVLVEKGQDVDLYTVYQLRAQAYQNLGDNTHYLEDLETSLEYLDSEE